MADFIGPLFQKRSLDRPGNTWARGAAVKNAKRKTTKKTKASTGGKRRAVVFACLLGVLGGTSILLKKMAPIPMRPDAADTLFAYGSSDSLNAIFQMQATVQPERWKYVYIHHSKTPGGSALTLGGSADGVGDHFVIGNGTGLADGELQISQRWNHQQAATAPSAGVKVESDCISICVIGDFDRSPPTPMQLGRLGQLVQALQLRCRIPASHVEWVNESGARHSGTVAGVGKLFPAAAFHDQLQNWPVAATP